MDLGIVQRADHGLEPVRLGHDVAVEEQEDVAARLRGTDVLLLVVVEVVDLDQHHVDRVVQARCLDGVAQVAASSASCTTTTSASRPAAPTWAARLRSPAARISGDVSFALSDSSTTLTSTVPLTAWRSSPVPGCTWETSPPDGPTPR